MKKITTLLLACALVGSASAQTISPKVALQKAAGVFAKYAPSSAAKGAATAEPQLAYVSVLNGDTCFYVFNNPQGGYAIIGGDLAAREVLATVDQGSFDINKVPDAVKFMLSEYAQNISAAKGSTVTASPTWTCGPDVTSSLMTTHWTQDPPYNNFCPSYSDTANCATGCVATAAAQAVYKALKGKTLSKNSKTYSHDVTLSTGKKTKVTQKYDATVNIYDDAWNMKDTYASNDESAAADNVATLMQIMGIISQMSYGEQSGTTSELLQRGLWNNLNVAAKFMVKETAGKSDQEWEQIIYNELSTGRPVIMGADTPDGKGGHEFVLDGYRQSDDNFHVNWGWGADYDGYFALTGTIAKANNVTSTKGDGSWMFPSAQGTGGSGQSKETAENSAYRNGHEIVYNLVLRGAKESKDIPEVDVNSYTIEQNKQSSAKGMALTETESIPTIYVGDGTEATEDYVMKVNFGEGITYNGENAKFVWAVILEPVFDGDEPEEYDCPILDATNGKDEPVEYKQGDVITGFTIPVGEYTWSADGSKDDQGEDTYLTGKYSVTPIMYFDPTGESEYISDENIVYVGTPYGWKAPVANFVAGVKPAPTAVTSVAAAAKKSSKAVKVIRKHGISIQKDGKQYNVAGQQM